LRISGRTRLCAVIGDPIEHSLSPCIHNAAFRHLGLDYVYVAFRVRIDELGEAISGMRALGIRGLNVTMPHKIRVIDYLDRLDENARNVGAVNTILNEDGFLIGYDTDGVGALNSIRTVTEDLEGKKLVVLGAGGASRAISFTLASEAGELVILNRTVSRARELAERINRATGRGVRWGELSRQTLERELEDADILINATSVGMHPNSNETPVDKELLRPDLTVFDLVYNPLETRLLREARNVGAKTIDGLTMLVHQGAASFKIWTGIEPPIDLMMKAAREELKKRGG